MHPHPWTSCLGLGLGSIGRRAGNIQGYDNEIKIAGSDAAIGHNPWINEAEPIAFKGDKVFQGKIASPAGTVHKGPQPSQNKTSLEGDER